MNERRVSDHPVPRGYRKSATIYDVAQLAGVSPSTVSRALNMSGRVSAKTERLVKVAAATLQFRFNPRARSLQTGRTGTFALILSDITNPVYFDLVRGAERVAACEGYALILAESQESAENESNAAAGLQSSVDGIILVASRLGDARIRELAQRKPLVVVNRQVDAVSGVVPNVRTGIRHALDHLAAIGHRRLAFLSGPTNSWMSELRWNTLIVEAPARGMSIVEIGPGAPTLEGGRQSLCRVRAAGVTAVIAYNDLMAIGLLQASHEARISVPADLSILGFDDIFGSNFTTPALTTIRSPFHEVGTVAVQQLIMEIEHQRYQVDHAIDTQFIERESTAPPNRHHSSDGIGTL
ncbi:LacI family transcriptional regulator [Cryobacterium lactosi]|uniref:LacI family transcriptional regulator n=1 Tax=Cryobacterium lactosi TaxID=1259202 RepID=A0A4R9BZ53_9MICO|nr:LacI family DNA-binding transcriptional regulator [Cryobacterium lactosi]TFD93060.1 LacI family transcriptional regulator [Cryobacterium lactosi]